MCMVAVRIIVEGRPVARVDSGHSGKLCSRIQRNAVGLWDHRWLQQRRLQRRLNGRDGRRDAVTRQSNGGLAVLLGALVRALGRGGGGFEWRVNAGCQAKLGRGQALEAPAITEIAARAQARTGTRVVWAGTTRNRPSAMT